MILKVTGGYLEVELAKNTLEEIGESLKKMWAEGEKAARGAEMEKIKGAGVSPSSSKSNQQGKLGAKPRMPI